MTGAASQRQLRLLRIYAAFTFPFACVPFLYYWFLDHGLGIEDYATLISIYYVTMVAAEIPTGYLADRFGRVVPAVLGPIMLAVGFVAIGGFDTFTAFAVGQMAMGLGHSILSGPPSSLLFETLRAEGRAELFLREESRIHAVRLAGTGVAFLLGGVLVEFFGLRTCILATAPLCLVAAVTAIGLREPRRSTGDALAAADDASLPTRRASILSSAVGDLRVPAIAWVLVYYVALFCLLRYPFHFYQEFLRQAQWDEPLFVGGLFFALNVVAAPCSRIAPRVVARLGESTVFWILPITLALSLMLMARQQNLIGIALFFLQQIPFGMHWAVVQNFANHRLHDRSRTTVLSMLSFAGRLVFAAILPLTVAAAGDVGTLYHAVGLVGLVATAVVMWFGRRHFVRPR